MFEGKDFSREFEDVNSSLTDPVHSVLKAEDVLSVSEQIRDIDAFKNIHPKERLYRIVSGKFNPFLKPSFNADQLASASTQALNDLREIRAPKTNISQSMARLTHPGKPFTDEATEQIDAMIENLRGKFDLPFDELYHKEKRLVDDVIKCEQALRAKEATLPPPVPHANFHLGNDSVVDSLPENQFAKEARLANEQRLKSQVDGDSGNSDFAF